MAGDFKIKQSYIFWSSKEIQPRVIIAVEREIIQYWALDIQSYKGNNKQATLAENVNIISIIYKYI